MPYKALCERAERGYQIFLKKAARRRLKENTQRRYALRQEQMRQAAYEALARANGLQRVVPKLAPAGRAPFDEARGFAFFFATATALIFCMQVHALAPGPGIWCSVYWFLRLVVRGRPRVTGKITLGHARKLVGRLADPPRVCRLVEHDHRDFINPGDW